MKNNFIKNLKSFTKWIIKWFKKTLFDSKPDPKKIDIREIIIEAAGIHGKDYMLKDFNSVCHLLMYLRQDGFDEYKYFALDTVADIIEALFIESEVPPMVKLRHPHLFPNKKEGLE